MGVVQRRAARALALAACMAVSVFLAAGCSAAGSVKAALSSVTPTRSVQPTTSRSIAGTVTPATTATAAAPATSAKSAATPTVTVTAKASAAHPSVSAAPTPASGGADSTLVWLVIGICAAALVIVLVAWLVHRSRRRRTATAAWRARVADAYAKGAALQDAIGGETLGAFDADRRWSDIQYRADDLAQTLYALRESAPDEEAGVRVANLLAALQAVRSAVSAERVPSGDAAIKAAAMRERLSFFDVALQDLREPAGQSL